MRLSVAEPMADLVVAEALAIARVRQLAAEQSMAAAPDEEARLRPYRFEPERYIREQMGWAPWGRSAAEPGQTQVLAAYALALRQQIERRDYEAGLLRGEDLVTWQPGQEIRNRIHVEAGYTVGKTKLAAGMVNHFFDSFVPSIIYAFAPEQDQVHDLLFKEIKADRTGKDLPGRILDLALDRGPNHFAKGRATNNANQTGRERIQGQHGPYLMFVLDEAEGIADFVWEAVDSMTSGGVVIVLMLANPRTRSSRFHKAGQRADTASFRISETWHPNAVEGHDVIPGAVRRDYVDGMLREHCQVVETHESDNHTFEVPWRPGVIYQPDAECLWKVLGIAPGNIADNTVIPSGRYEAACKREPVPFRPDVARLGLDAARGGRDSSTLYLRHNGVVRRLAQFAQLDDFDQALAVKRHMLALAEQGVTSLHLRVDAGGGYGTGITDPLMHDLELIRAFDDLLFVEVHFGSQASDQRAYADLVTEMYFEAAESLKGLAVVDAPNELEADLTERAYKWVNLQGIAVRRLEQKDDFKKVHNGRSPDDGDGFVLATAPDHIFIRRGPDVVVYDQPFSISRY